MRIPLIAGRYLTDADRRGGERVLVVTQAAARRFWPKGDALGKYLTLGARPSKDDVEGTVVGIVGDTRDAALSEDPEPAAFFPLDQVGVSGLTLVVRTEQRPESVGTAVRDVVRRLDSDLPIVGMTTMEDVVSRSRRGAEVLRISLALRRRGAGLAAIGISRVLCTPSPRRRGKSACASRRCPAPGRDRHGPRKCRALGDRSRRRADAALLLTRLLSGILSTSGRSIRRPTRPFPRSLRRGDARGARARPPGRRRGPDDRASAGATQSHDRTRQRPSIRPALACAPTGAGRRGDRDARPRIGANVAVFSVVDGLMLRELPVREPSSLALVTWSSREWPTIVQDLKEAPAGRGDGPDLTHILLLSAFEAFASQSRSFPALCDDGQRSVGQRPDRRPRRIRGHPIRVGSFFDIPGSARRRDAHLIPADDRPAGWRRRVLSHAFWVRRSGGDPSAIGRPITINGKSVLLVGAILPAKFFGLSPGRAGLWRCPADLLGRISRLHGERRRPLPGPEDLVDRDGWRAPAGRELAVRRRRIAPDLRIDPSAHGFGNRFPPADSRHPADCPRRGLDTASPRHAPAHPLRSLRHRSRHRVHKRGGLLLARATSRNREIAIRRSLGANTPRPRPPASPRVSFLRSPRAARPSLVAGALTAAVLASSATRSRHPFSSSRR